MRAVVQRVSRASVSVDGEVIGSIEFGMLILLGVSSADTDELAAKLADKKLVIKRAGDDVYFWEREGARRRRGRLRKT